MKDPITVLVRPLGVRISMPAGGSLADELVRHGVEFPCGGQGRCRGCRFRLLEGALPESEADLRQLSEAERKDGWRLACAARPESDISIELRQWAGIILADETPFEFAPASGLGVAVDIGTTTMVAQLVGLATGRVLGTQTALNPQAGSGADVMSRIRAALKPGGLEHLQTLVRRRIAIMVEELLAHAPAGEKIVRATMVGNTAMHHLFLGHDVTPLAGYPFEPRCAQGARLSGAELGWPERAAGASVFFLPVLGGFVGSDILAVILATRIHQAEEVTGGTDLGTNGEIVIGDKRRILVASTAAGPAFEGARISQGMRAAPGAIDRVSISGNRLSVHVVGGGAPRGICGSGLVDAVACGLDLGAIAPSGRMESGAFELREPVKLLQQDVRELQLAKGAIAAGIRILLARTGVEPERFGRFFLAGAFGNNLSVENTRRLGLLPFRTEAIAPVGNAALLGAKLALFDENHDALKGLCERIEHVSLEKTADFQDLFAEAMIFPERRNG